MKIKFLKSIILLVVSILLITTFGNYCYSANLKNAFGNDSPLQKIAGDSGAGYDTSNEGSIEKTIGQILTILFSFLGIIFLILMIYSGFLWMTARGDEAQVTKARGIMTAAIIGLIIILMSYVISYFIIKNIGEGTLKNSSSTGNSSSAIYDSSGDPVNYQ